MNPTPRRSDATPEPTSAPRHIARADATRADANALPPTPKATPQKGASWRAAWRRATKAMHLDRHARFWMREIDPTWSASETIARVVGVRDETHDTRTFLLRPNARWRGHEAGHFVTIQLEIDGARVYRCYSLSSAPGDALLAITVKRVPGGRVSNWMHEHLRPGDTLGLSEALGEFTLSAQGTAPAQAPSHVLFIAAGSGVTPFLSMLSHLDQTRAIDDIVLVLYARSAADLIGGARLRDIAARNPGLQVHLFFDTPEQPAFEPQAFRDTVPNFARRATWLCGPPGLMSRVQELYADANALQRLTLERFTPALRPTTLALDPAHNAELTLAENDERLRIHGRSPLLQQLEEAGRKPAHGCRMGICNTCRCRKLSGVVEDARTGLPSSEGEEEIRLCVSIPRGNITLAL